MAGQGTYTLRNFKRALRTPELVARHMNKLYHHRLGTRNHNYNGVDIFAEDWDSLLLLDACRYDMMAERDDLPGRLEHRISRGASSTEFLLGNFANRDLLDTVYVTANAHISKYEDRINPNLHATIEVYEEAGWHEELNTVLPETMNEYALRAAEQYPDKRLIVHYIQPHQPFIGPTGREHFDTSAKSPWVQFLEGEANFTEQQLRDAFSENLDIVVPYARELMEELNGKTVVSADHGQMIGERSAPLPLRDYGHPDGVHVPELVKVPWLVYENGNRREIVAEEPSEQAELTNDEVVSDRLEHLGYKQ
jgi:hypothetical protein